MTGFYLLIVDLLCNTSCEVNLFLFRGRNQLKTEYELPVTRVMNWTWDKSWELDNISNNDIEPVSVQPASDKAFCITDIPSCQPTYFQHKIFPNWAENGFEILASPPWSKATEERSKKRERQFQGFLQQASDEANQINFDKEHLNPRRQHKKYWEEAW